MNSTAIRCEAPPHSPGDVSVGVSVNGVDVISSGAGKSLFLTYVEAPLIDSMSPSLGPVSGGTVVHLYSRALSSDLWCRFGDRNAKATRHSASHASCVTPLLTLRQ